jgi:hypothetical protein
MVAVDPISTLDDVLLPEYNRLKTNQRVTIFQNGFSMGNAVNSYVKPGFDRLDNYVRGIQDNPYKPREAKAGYQVLMDRSKLNMLDLVIDYRAQNLKIEGYKDTSNPENANSPLWNKYWQANKMDRRQLSLWRTAFTFGVAYAVPMPAEDSLTGQKMISINLYSPREFVAVYEDPANDDWPTAAMRHRKLPSKKGQRDDEYEVTLFDDTNIYVITGSTDRWVIQSTTPHGSPVVPVVRYLDKIDLEGRVTGQVEPLIPLQDRLNQSCFDLIMTETFSSFRVRWITGVMFGEVDDNGELDEEVAADLARRGKINIANDQVLAFPDPDTKVGDLPSSDLAPLIQVVQQNVRLFAIKSQTPPQDFLGDVGGNISADALSALEASSGAKTLEKQKTFGEATELLLRLCAIMDGDTSSANDTSSQVVWGEAETRSLASIADAYGKIATLLMVPVEELWQYLPGVTQQDVERWKLAKKRADAQNLANQLMINAGGVNDIVQPAAPGGSSPGPAKPSPGGSAQRATQQSARQSGPPVEPGRPVGS